MWPVASRAILMRIRAGQPLVFTPLVFTPCLVTERAHWMSPVGGALPDPARWDVSSHPFSHVWSGIINSCRSPQIGTVEPCLPRPCFQRRGQGTAARSQLLCSLGSQRVVFIFLKDRNWIFTKISPCYFKKPHLFSIWSFIEKKGVL